MTFVIIGSILLGVIILGIVFVSLVYGKYLTDNQKCPKCLGNMSWWSIDKRVCDDCSWSEEV